MSQGELVAGGAPASGGAAGDGWLAGGAPASAGALGWELVPPVGGAPGSGSVAGLVEPDEPEVADEPDGAPVGGVYRPRQAVPPNRQAASKRVLVVKRISFAGCRRHLQQEGRQPEARRAMRDPPPPLRHRPRRVGDAAPGLIRVAARAQMASMRRHLRLLCVALLLGIGAAGCARVKPYERERLALPGMQLDPASDEAQHVYESREASAGAYGALGAGCGCN